MTRKDYKLIAGALSRILPGIVNRTTIPFHAGEANAMRNAAHSLADALQADNPRFDRERFIAACGVQS